MAQENVTHDRQEVLIARVVGVRTQRVRRAPETLLDRFDVFQLGQSRSLNCSMILAGCGVAEAAKSRISAGTVGENLCDVASGQSGGNESARSRGRSFEGWGWATIHRMFKCTEFGTWHLCFENWFKRFLNAAATVHPYSGEEVLPSSHCPSRRPPTRPATDNFGLSLNDGDARSRRMTASADRSLNNGMDQARHVSSWRPGAPVAAQMV